MTVDALATTPIRKCKAGYCDGAVVAFTGGLCARHITALRLTTRFQDAVLEFLNSSVGRHDLRPGTKYAKEIALAGSCFAHGLNMLVGALFDKGVVFDAEPIYSDINDGETTSLRWRVDLKWEIKDEDDE
ncbi:hypothetical protein [Mycobacterium avium]|uniref:hypothetical protein n=1 Tax=Mycobacterium avium TaxID=1764 RepID=UPI001CDC3637|nr:hypothetical protein [Mycobacterium avium]MCA4732155.1 hypothetical protein [Mycobacterium avium subsp. hominissuis]MDO2361002.1 hypothetical protein [Mycobacterium avium subsp. hominissuis]UBV03747.1 hypothetical protein H8Z54_14975 [Mycobacterium avium subsp. hominissuis]